MKIQSISGTGNGIDEKYKDEVEDRFGGYMYWCFTKYDIDAPEFQVFHPKDFTESDYVQLKEFVINEINKITNVPTNGE